jgi:hypothetical protein
LESYRIGALFVINPTNRLDRSGALIADADADGLADNLETSTTVGLARTNGRCLDMITANNACAMTTSCNEKVDRDGDGLNECEEQIYLTDEKDFDSDGDGIPDGIEVIYGFDPRLDDRQHDSNSDGLKNIENFKAGAGPLTKIKLVPAENKIHLEYELMDYGQEQDNESQRAVYLLRLHRLPYFLTAAATVSQLFYTLPAVTINEVPIHLTGAGHTATETPLILLARINNSLHQTDVHWGYTKLLLQGSVNSSLDLDLSNMTYFRAPDGATE